MNRVAGANNPRGPQQRVMEVQSQLDGLPQQLTSVKKGTLYFIITPISVNEGKLRVGLARADADVDSVDGAPPAEVRVSWFIRSKWRSCKQFEWDQTSTFERAGDPIHRTRQLKTDELLSTFLPIAVQETPASTRDKPRIPAPCIRLLEELCLQRDLVRQPPPLLLPSAPPPAEEGDSSSPNPVDTSDESDEQDDDSSDEGRPSLLSDHPVQGPLLRAKRAREAAHAQMVQRVDAEMRTTMDTGVRPDPQLQGIHAAARPSGTAAPSRDSGSSVCQDDRETRRLRRSSTVAART